MLAENVERALSGASSMARHRAAQGRTLKKGQTNRWSRQYRVASPGVDR